jgi:hypothetical protein
MSKPIILLIIGSDFHLRSVIAGEVLETLSDFFDIKLIFSSEVRRNEFKLSYQKEIYQVPKIAKILFPLVLNTSMLLNRHKSSSFRLRIQRSLLSDYKTGIPIHLRSWSKLALAMLFSIPILRNGIEALYRKILDVSLTPLINKAENIAFVISWAQSLEPTSLAAIRLAKLIKTKSVLVFDNWDNLSSKCALFEHPDFIFCFGEQSREFAAKIHGFPSSQVFAIGSARFDAYKSVSANRGHATSILIAGSSLAMEDLSILDCLERIVESSPKDSSIQQYQFLYRPHPAPQGLKVDFANWSYSKISLDHSVMQKTSGAVNFGLQEQVVSVLAQQAVVIGSPTTLILEALLCKIPVIVPLIGHPAVRTTNKLMLQELEHLKPLHQMRNVFFCEDPNTLETVLMRLIADGFPFLQDDLISQLVVTEPGLFSERLARVLLGLLSE